MISHIFSFGKWVQLCTPSGDGPKDSPQFQVHSKQLQMHRSAFSAISQYMEMTLGYDKEHKWR